MRMKGSFILSIEDFGKVKMNVITNLEDRYGHYSSPKEHFEEHINWNFHEPKDIKLLQIEMDDELKNEESSFEVLERYPGNEENFIYIVVVSCDESSYVSTVNTKIEKCVISVLNILKDDLVGSHQIQSWKDGERVKSVWIGGNR